MNKFDKLLPFLEKKGENTNVDNQSNSNITLTLKRNVFRFRRVNMLSNTSSEPSVNVDDFFVLRVLDVIIIQIIQFI